MNLRFQLNRIIDFYRRNGFTKTTKKIFTKIWNKISKSSAQKKLEQEENNNYQTWIKENEPSLEELESRLRGRGTETEDVILKRLNQANEDLEMKKYYQYHVVNVTVEKAVEDIKNIVLNH